MEITASELNVLKKKKKVCLLYLFNSFWSEIFDKQNVMKAAQKEAKPVPISAAPLLIRLSLCKHPFSINKKGAIFFLPQVS